jgi:hypothetical protein
MGLTQLPWADDRWLRIVNELEIAIELPIGSLGGWSLTGNWPETGLWEINGGLLEADLARIVESLFRGITSG